MTFVNHTNFIFNLDILVDIGYGLDMVLPLHVVFVCNEVFLSDNFLYYWLKNYTVINNFHLSDYLVNFIFAKSLTSDIFSIWYESLNVLNFDIINKLYILDSIRYTAAGDRFLDFDDDESDFLSIFSLFEIWKFVRAFNPFKKIIPSGDANDALITLVHDYNLYDNLSNDLGWLPYTNNHLNYSSIIFSNQPFFVYMSDESYIYSPLQANIRYALFFPYLSYYSNEFNLVEFKDLFNEETGEYFFNSYENRDYIISDLRNYYFFEAPWSEYDNIEFFSSIYHQSIMYIYLIIYLILFLIFL